MNVPPLSALPPPPVPPVAPRAEVEGGRGRRPFDPEALGRLHPAPTSEPRLAAVTVALVVLVVAAACWALAARLIGPDAWVVAIGFAVVPVALASSWPRR